MAFPHKWWFHCKLNPKQYGVCEKKIINNDYLSQNVMWTHTSYSDIFL